MCDGLCCIVSGRPPKLSCTNVSLATGTQQQDQHPPVTGCFPFLRPVYILCSIWPGAGETGGINIHAMDTFLDAGFVVAWRRPTCCAPIWHEQICDIVPVPNPPVTGGCILPVTLDTGIHTYGCPQCDQQPLHTQHTRNNCKLNGAPERTSRYARSGTLPGTHFSERAFRAIHSSTSVHMHTKTAFRNALFLERTFVVQKCCPERAYRNASGTHFRVLKPCWMHRCHRTYGVGGAQ